MSTSASKIHTIVLGTLVLLSHCLTGCSGSATPLEPVTLQFGYVSLDNQPDLREYYNQLATQFHEEHPHITVEVEHQSLYTIFIEREADNDVMVVPDYVFITLLDNGNIIPLDDFIVLDSSFPLDDYYPGVLDIFTFEGKNWGIPSGVNPYVIFYNKEIFDHKGIPYPDPDWTWDDFLATALSVRDSDENIYGYGSTYFFIPGTKYMESLIFIYQHGGEALDDFRRPTKFVYDDPLMIESLEWYTSLFTTYNVAPTESQAIDAFGGSTNNTIFQGIAGGKVAMWSGGFGDRNGGYTWPVPWQFPIGVLPFPRDAKTFNPAYCAAYVITSDSMYPEESWLWISFLADQMNILGTPVRRSMIESKEYENLVGSDFVDVIKIIMERLSFFPAFTGTDIAIDWNDFQTVLRRVIDREVDLQDALDYAENK
jgi:multiple sugar transport system substrate-binding protein